jgi:hypothetical protein
MIGVFVTFRYGGNFDERAVRKIAETARVRFEGMPGLRSKAFTLNSGKREAANFYVWDSEEGAKAFFTDELLERVAGLYGVRPSIEFVQIATLVENIRPYRYSGLRPLSLAGDLRQMADYLRRADTD